MVFPRSRQEVSRWRGRPCVRHPVTETLLSHFSGRVAPVFTCDGSPLSCGPSEAPFFPKKTAAVGLMSEQRVCLFSFQHFQSFQLNLCGLKFLPCLPVCTLRYLPCFNLSSCSLSAEAAVLFQPCYCCRKPSFVEL